MMCPTQSEHTFDAARFDEADAAAMGVAGEFIFCEGCGARLRHTDRACPKCGRPAPGILSEHSAASDLAAGKTASFPRVTNAMLADAVPAPAPSKADELLEQTLDAQATSVLSGDAIDAALGGSPSGASSRRVGRKRSRPEAARDAQDAYAKPRRGRAVVLVLVLALIAGGAWFVLDDPWGVMPSFYEQFRRAAGEMYPSRETPERPATTTGEAGGASTDEADADTVSDSALSEQEALDTLTLLYNDIIAQHDALGSIIDDYNTGFADPDLSRRQQYAAGAYAARDALDADLEQLRAIELGRDSAYADDVEHLVQLAEWARSRVDMYCASWDISLSFTGAERPGAHQAEILAPLRDRRTADDEARENFYAHVVDWRPQ